jgi:hypothetical protein
MEKKRGFLNLVATMGASNTGHTYSRQECRILRYIQFGENFCGDFFYNCSREEHQTSRR